MPLGENESVVILWIWIGIGLLFLTTLFIILLITIYLKNIKKNKQKLINLVRNTQSECLENTIYLQEKDRERLAEELHDNIISRLNLIRLNAQYKDMNEINTDLKNSMQLIRELTHNLTPPDLSEIELTGLIEDYLEQVKSSISVEYSKYIFGHLIISNQIKLNLFRIIQELINNTLKHAEASKISITIRISSQNVALIFKDNGKGFSAGNQQNGIGLRSIQLRLKQINAHYKLKTKPQKGTKYIIFLTIKQQ